MYELKTNVLGLDATVEYEVHGGDEIEVTAVYNDEGNIEVDYLYRKKKVTRQGVDEYIYVSIDEELQEECLEHYRNNRDNVPDVR